MKSFDDKSLSNIQKLNLLKKAISSYRQKKLMSLNGKGIDRYLISLRIISWMNGMEVDLFKNKGFLESCNWKLSTTSSLSNLINCFFVPVCNDGYGVVYYCGPSGFHFDITCFLEDTTTSTQRYISVLEKTLDDFKLFLESFTNSKL